MAGLPLLLLTATGAAHSILQGLPQQLGGVECGGFMLFFMEQMMQHGAIQVKPDECILTRRGGYEQAAVEAAVASSTPVPAGTTT